MKRIGIMVHLGKSRALELAAKIRGILTASGLEVWVPEEAAEVLGWLLEKLYIGGALGVSCGGAGR